MENQNIDVISKGLWERARVIFLSTLLTPEEKSQAERYFGMIVGVTANDNVFNFNTTSEFAANLLQSDYAEKLKSSFVLAGGDSSIQLKFHFEPNAVKPILVTPTQRIQAEIRSQVQPSTFISTLPLNEEYTFEEFVRGPSNSFALSAAEGVVKHPGRTGYNPLFIHGGTGLGKTHLMQAIGNELRRTNPNLAICYLTAETFMNEYVNSMKNNNISEFRHKYRSIDVLLLDDVQFLQKGKETQEEFFNTFNALRDKHKQIVMTSDVAPKNLPSIEERLISRFEGGMVQEIESPSYETRLAILKKKSESSDSAVPDIALEFIADNIKSHVRAMEGALGKVTVYIDNYSSTTLTKEILARILKDFIEKEKTLRKLTIEEIQKECAKKYGTTLAEILSHERTQSLVTPRQMAMYIARKYTSRGLKEISDAFGKTHATIINGVKTIKQRLENETQLKIELEEILSTFGYNISDAVD